MSKFISEKIYALGIDNHDSLVGKSYAMQRKEGIESVEEQCKKALIGVYHSKIAIT